MELVDAHDSIQSDSERQIGIFAPLSTPYARILRTRRAKSLSYAYVVPFRPSVAGAYWVLAKQRDMVPII